MEAAKTIQAVIKRTIVECNCSDDTNADDGDTKKRPRERRRVGEESRRTNWRRSGGRSSGHTRRDVTHQFI
ncbi:hypothetical protein T03_5169 [Trichinella britovi]|uniref:Uncharacterized protein n=1 Tax=Trichinella britovi TaxID=45882 RepID=A0A0V1CCQ7_TRIBR|nr:hypothetical protein T03_5169 [Trichinella britovi]